MSLAEEGLATDEIRIAETGRNTQQIASVSATRAGKAWRSRLDQCGLRL
jgi:hypothetical protein